MPAAREIAHQYMHCLFANLISIYSYVCKCSVLLVKNKFVNDFFFTVQSNYYVEMRLRLRVMVINKSILKL